MIINFLKRIFGSANDRLLATHQPIVEKVSALEETMANLSDRQLQDQTRVFKGRLEKGESLDDILVEAFAVVREASKRVLGKRHFDVQILCGSILHNNMIAEMKTGEGKTLVATAPVYLNALTGKGVHVVTVNDYLAKRDSEEMGLIYKFLGLSVGVIVGGMSDQQRKEAYACDVTHGTNNEMGFDYLRDNMKYRPEDMTQRGHNYAIIDEADNILIDEARTPLIISGPAEQSSDLYLKVNKIIPLLKDSDYELDEKSHNVTLTEEGSHNTEKLLKKEAIMEKEGSMYELGNIKLVHYVNQALKAHKLFKKDRDYIVREGQILIIDEFTGRISEGRRFSDGLHQAIEAKEGVKVQVENQTLASITYQNYFRLYDKLAGMTGTAETDADEFMEIYNLGVAVLPTNRPMIRKNNDDEIYRTAREKNNAILALVKECMGRKQPILLGTTSIAKSEELASLLKAENVNHSVLNAKYHQSEAEIISQAGVPGMVTIATNMAGRGTDIKLGGNEEEQQKAEITSDMKPDQIKKINEKINEKIAKDRELVIESGGLYVIGSERHESRRIDNQLRGRAGRQGDPGAAKFFLSLEDDLMRIFGSDTLTKVLDTLGMEEGEAITHSMVSRALERAQRKIEVRNFEIRKQLLKYDDVLNQQRNVVYKKRLQIIKAKATQEFIEDTRIQTVEELVYNAIPENSHMNDWNMAYLHEEILRIFGLDLPVAEWAKEDNVSENHIIDRILEHTNDGYKQHIKDIDQETAISVEKTIMLQTLDQSWKDHLLMLDHLRQGIHLRAYGQKDPLNEYKAEAFVMFEEMLKQSRYNCLQQLSKVEFSHIRDQDLLTVSGGLDFSDMNLEEIAKQLEENLGGELDPKVMDKLLSGIKKNNNKEKISSNNKAPKKPSKAKKKVDNDVGRNEGCPCGSGKRYKHCCGTIDKD